MGAVDGLLGVALPVALLAALALLTWAGLGAPTAWTPFVLGAADVWLIGHGVDVRFALPGGSFTVTAAALGPALVSALCAVRAGRRAARTGAPTAAWTAGVVATGLATVPLLLAGTTSTATPSPWQAVLLPTLLVGVVSLLAVRSVRVTRPLPTGIRAGLAAAALVVAAAGVLLVVALFSRLGEVVGLAETLDAGPIGGAVLTGLQLIALPTLVVWSASWVSGAGVTLGGGSDIGPFGGQVGPLPALPVLGAVPTDPSPLAAAVVLVPVVAGFVAGVLARRGGATGGALPLGGATGVVAGVVLGVLAAAAAGAAGPGRFGTVGPNALLVALLVALETGLPAVLAAAVVRPRRAPDPDPAPH